MMNQAPQTEVSQMLKKLVTDLAETVKPLVEEIHNAPKVSKDYYQEYLALLSQSSQDKTKIKILAMALLTLGCNPNGVDAAVKILTD